MRPLLVLLSLCLSTSAYADLNKVIYSLTQGPPRISGVKNPQIDTVNNCDAEFFLSSNGHLFVRTRDYGGNKSGILLVHINEENRGRGSSIELKDASTLVVKSFTHIAKIFFTKKGEDKTLKVKKVSVSRRIVDFTYNEISCYPGALGGDMGLDSKEITNELRSPSKEETLSLDGPSNHDTKQVLER